MKIHILFCIERTLVTLTTFHFHRSVASEHLHFVADLCMNYFCHRRPSPFTSNTVQFNSNTFLLFLFAGGKKQQEYYNSARSHMCLQRIMTPETNAKMCAFVCSRLFLLNIQ